MIYASKQAKAICVKFWKRKEIKSLRDHWSELYHIQTCQKLFGSARKHSSISSQTSPNLLKDGLKICTLQYFLGNIKEISKKCVNVLHGCFKCDSKEFRNCFKGDPRKIYAFFNTLFSRFPAAQWSAKNFMWNLFNIHGMRNSFKILTSAVFINVICEHQ